MAAGLPGLVDGRSEERKPTTPRLLAFNLPGGVHLKMRLSAGTSVDVIEGRFGIAISLEREAKKAGEAGGLKAD